VTIFRSPHSYTTEDVVEISCHGSVFIARKILDLLVGSGARLAGPGEFTRRAFLNGRIDLSQAEAVADLIRADSAPSHNLALAQLRGSLSVKVSQMRTKVLDICSMIELELDFSEEGLEFVGREKLINDLETLRDEISQLIESYEHGKIQREGLRIVLAGSPNVGKSSILNSLIQEDRAIVSEISGTTRDTIEESVVIDGTRFNIIDTAGLRETHDALEVEGIKRTREQINHADIILLIIDSMVGTHIREDIDLVGSYLGDRSHKEIIIIFNKSDLVQENQTLEMGKKYSAYRTVLTSTKTPSGMNELKKLIGMISLRGKGRPDGESIMISNMRQRNTLQNAANSLDFAIQGVKNGVSADLLSVDLRGALSYFSEVVGVDISEEVLNNIFLRFCIGK